MSSNNMTLVDKLEEAAKEATPEQWTYDMGNGEVETLEWRVAICCRAGNLERQEDVDYRFGNDEELIKEISESYLSVDNNNDLYYIALANPQNILKLCAMVREAERALEFYEASHRYLSMEDYVLNDEFEEIRVEGTPDIVDDAGEVAREALKKLRGEE